MSPPSPLRVLVVTSEWPTAAEPYSGIAIARQVEHLRQVDLDVEVFNFRGGGNPLRYLRAIKQFRRVYRSKVFDLVHVQHGQSGLIVAGLSTCPVIVTFRGSDLQGLSGTTGRYSPVGYLLPRVSRVVARFANEVILVSEHMARYIPERSYHVIPAGLDLGLFTPIPQSEAREQCGLPQDRRLALFVGNPQNPIKRFDLARRAVALVDGTRELEVVVCSGVRHEQVPLYLNACDVLLVTSLHEGSPSSVKEALACNLPVVSTDVGDVRERLAGIEGCIVLEDDRPETVAKGLESVLRASHRIEGRATVMDLDERLLAQRVIDVYRRALSNHRS